MSDRACRSRVSRPKSQTLYVTSHSIDPFSYTGTVAFFDCTALHQAFANAHILEIPLLPSSRKFSETASSDTIVSKDADFIKVPKVGILERKDDLVEGGKKATSRKWKAWSVLLTGSQLLLFVSCLYPAGTLS